MRTTFLSALLFAFLTSASVAVTAAPSSAQNAPTAATVTQEQSSDRVNINKADAETLQKELSGIGLAKAAAIVAYRDANGEFTSVDELIEVKGIGKALLDKNREKLAIN